MRCRLRKTFQYLFLASVTLLVWRELKWIDGNRDSNSKRGAGAAAGEHPLVAGVNPLEQRVEKRSAAGAADGAGGGGGGGGGMRGGREPLWQSKQVDGALIQKKQREAVPELDVKPDPVLDDTPAKNASLIIRTKFVVSQRGEGPNNPVLHPIQSNESIRAGKPQHLPPNTDHSKGANPIPLDLRLNDLSNIAANRPQQNVANFTIVVHNPGDVQSNPQIHKQMELSDIFIGVKTTGKYHKERLQIILDTWYSLAPEQTNFFTDVDDVEFQQKANGHMINTQCQGTHSRLALCCKTSFMLDMFYKTDKRWFCNVDDDNYLNVPELLKLLRQYDHTQDHYLGRASLSHPIEAIDRYSNQRVSFWFATGGAGFCISKSLAMKMAVYASSGTFEKMCNRIRLPDDVTIGFIIEVLLKKPLTKVQTFNSHLQLLRSIPTGQLQKQLTLSYSITPKRVNVINMPSSLYSLEDDPTRFKTFHCTYFRGFGNCPPGS
ncbi:beta-1,3-N-acetylglucosaminyltransferase radical fringe-like [Diadema setosum]|uniref:beta-1,3-N-acetylglucosaminyltransferase radical fringe-like n=1 Tax=Diadema setosum TaxID=31175 RepID=UPI003B3AE10E